MGSVVTDNLFTTRVLLAALCHNKDQSDAKASKQTANGKGKQQQQQLSVLLSSMTTALKDLQSQLC